MKAESRLYGIQLNEPTAKFYNFQKQVIHTRCLRPKERKPDRKAANAKIKFKFPNYTLSYLHCLDS